MASPIVNFSTSIETLGGQPKLILTDTTDYTGTDTLTGEKTWIITKSDASKQILPNPSGILEYPLTEDLALAIELVVNYEPDNELSWYSKSKNVLASYYLTSALYDMRKDLLDLYNKNCNPKDVKRLISHLTLTATFEEASRAMLSTDIIATQKALDLGIREVDNYKYSK